MAGPPPVIDLDGEMPDGAVVGPTSSAPDPPVGKSDDIPRLADIKLNLGGGGRSSPSARQTTNPSLSARPKGRFVEYDEGDVEALAPSSTPSATPRAETPEFTLPAAEAEGVEVVRVVKKKKKPRSDGASTVRFFALRGSPLDSTDRAPAIYSQPVASTAGGDATAGEAAPMAKTKKKKKQTVDL